MPKKPEQADLKEVVVPLTPPEEGNAEDSSTLALIHELREKPGVRVIETKAGHPLSVVGENVGILTRKKATVLIIEDGGDAT